MLYRLGLVCWLVCGRGRVSFGVGVISCGAARCGAHWLELFSLFVVLVWNLKFGI